MKICLFVLCLLLAVADRALAEPTYVAEETEEWQLAVKFRYETSALTRFLEDTIATIRVVEGIDLTKSRRGERWVIEGRTMHSGDWVFQVSPPRSKLFTLTCLIEGSDRRVVFSCVRENESRFRVILTEVTTASVIKIPPVPKPILEGDYDSKTRKS